MLADPGIVLFVDVPSAMVNFMELDEEQTENTVICVVAEIDLPRRNDAEFEFVSLNSTTASSEDFDIAPRIVTVPTGFSGFYNECVTLSVLGDGTAEQNELIELGVRPASDLDSVEFPEGAESLLINIFDNDGKMGHM